ncbi:MAG: helix-turn-helix domain-containing protein [Terriglobia bacterium]
MTRKSFTSSRHVYITRQENGSLSSYLQIICTGILATVVASTAECLWGNLLVTIVFGETIFQQRWIWYAAVDNFSFRFGRVVKQYRLKQKLSQEKLAEAASLDRTFVSMIERGRRRPTLDTAKQIAEALGTSLSSLVAMAERRRS